ncbi:copper chaperone PCu(A)C [Actinocorallia populi]|uniref:hypothetical protein n=1 Tax=Actinocorallia populi TaxID=2079200 RepID=UPI000D0971C7|nr:hypothetical protein [Actinocorallia populi]
MRFTRAAAAAFLATALLSGCGDAENDKDQPSDVSPEAGVSGEVGQVDIRDLFVLGGDQQDIPAGGSAPVYLTLINRPAGGEPDPTAGTAAAEDDTLESVSSTAAGSAEIIGGPVRLPPGQDVRIGPDARIVLRDLAEDLDSDASVPLTLKFQKAGSVTLSAPVVERQGSYTTYSPAP